MKVTKGGKYTGLLSNSSSTPAGGVTVVDAGGYFSADDLEDILQEIGAGTAPGSFLRTTLGGLDVVQALGTLGADETIDLANANVFWGTLDQDCTITTVGWTPLRGATIRVEWIQGGAGNFVPTFSGVTWIGAAPSGTATGTVGHAILFSRDGGTTIYGAVVGGSGASATQAWMPLTTVFDGEPQLVWDANNSLIPTLVPLE